MMALQQPERESELAGSVVLRWFDHAVEAWLRQTRDELSLQETKHPRWFVSRREAA
ncbi:MAG TPA: hypothetical protein VFB45_14025 [Pseudolabrys sp.]|nr:hypothetical protein [Pseudolabrys sp.]